MLGTRGSQARPAPLNRQGFAMNGALSCAKLRTGLFIGLGSVHYA